MRQTVEWHHQRNTHEFEQTPRDNEGQGSLAGCSPWGHKESDRTWQLSNNNPFAQLQATDLGKCISHTHAQSRSRVQLFMTPWTVAHRAPLSMGVSRQEYWSRLPCPPPGDFPDPGIKSVSHVLLSECLLNKPLNLLNGIESENGCR